MREVVVTGGGTGIGYAVVQAFTGAGDQVTITGRREQVLAGAAARLGARRVAFDAADPAAIQAALPQLPERVDRAGEQRRRQHRPDPRRTRPG